MTKNAGYITLSRKFFNSFFWKEERNFSPAEAWLYLISNARFEVAPERVLVGSNIIVIHRGELRASQRYLAKKFQWSLGKVNRFIKTLKNESMIETRNEHGETIIKLLNYNNYNQATKKTNERIEEQQTEQPRERGGTTTGTATEQTKRISNKEKNFNKNLSLSEKDEKERIFQLFYFKNTINPLDELNNFWNHYKSAGWKDANGNKVTDKLAKAERWRPQQKGIAIEPIILNKWQQIFNLLGESHADTRMTLLKFTPKFIEGKTLSLIYWNKDKKACEEAVHTMENGISTDLFSYIRLVFGEDVKLDYKLKTNERL